jgi:hypothetical protein
MVTFPFYYLACHLKKQTKTTTEAKSRIHTQSNPKEQRILSP